MGGLQAPETQKECAGKCNELAVGSQATDEPVIYLLTRYECNGDFFTNHAGSTAEIPFVMGEGEQPLRAAEQLLA